jgi:peptidase M23-like protein
VYRHDGGPLHNFNRFYAGDGTRNEDWFGWNEPLLAPFDGVVRLILRNEVTNRPGTRGPDPAASILFQRLGDPPDAPVQVGYVHVQDIQVKAGDTVHAGQVVARLGNSGNALFPHLHVGGLRGDLVRALKNEIPQRDLVPLQVRFDLAAMGRIRGYVR